jgi:Stage II sporulation protein E (SpoIIE)
MNPVSPWQTTSRRSIVVFLSAVFFVFTTMGFANDIMDLGQQPRLRFGMGVLLSGMFAVCYAIAGITLRGRFWKAFVPLFALQFVVMLFLARWLPEGPQVVQLDAAGLGRLHMRLLFDGIGTIVAVSLGYAGFIYVSVSEARRYARTQTEMALLEGEMAAARQVQQLILPEQGETFPGYTVESIYQPARQVGGDFFQILPAGDGGLLVVVGDVAGKGLPAAMLVSMLVGSIRATAEHTHDPVLMLRRLHDRLMGRTGGGFSTALAAYIAGDGLVTIANAGHLSPYLDGREIELAGALPLGIAEGGQYEATTFELRPGSRLTFYSDGVVEAQNASGELFGFDRAKAISMQPAAAIVEEAVRFGQADDITVVTIERLTAPVAAAAVRSATAVTPA